MKKVCIIGGGGAAVINALKNVKRTEIYCVVSVFGSGGSTGAIRKEFGVYALGGVRDALIAASENKKMASLFAQRISIEGVEHSVGNLLLLNLIKKYGGRYIKKASELLRIPDNTAIIPVLDEIYYTGNLVINTQHGTLIGQHNLNDGEDIKVRGIRLSKPAKINPAASKAILEADYIIFGPGDLYSSVLPNALVSGFKEALHNSKGKKILIVDIMNKVNETDDFTVSDFVLAFNKHDIWFDKVIINDTVEKKKKSRDKHRTFSGFVDNDWYSDKGIVADLIKKDVIHEHDPRKLGAVLRRLFKK